MSRPIRNVKRAVVEGRDMPTSAFQTPSTDNDLRTQMLRYLQIVSQMLCAAKGVQKPHPASAAAMPLEGDPMHGQTAIMGHSLGNTRNFLGPGGGAGETEATPGGRNFAKLAWLL